jgi:predicted dinucleotide-binding enzyme
MNIAVIGAGNIGATLTRRLTAVGHDVRVATRADRLPHEAAGRGPCTTSSAPAGSG